MSNHLMVQMMDVGQGDSTIVQVIKKNGQPYRMMVDCGSMKGIESARSFIFDALNLAFNNNINPSHIAINDLYLTHADQDHYNLLEFICTGEHGNKVSFGQVTYGCTTDLYANGIEKDWTKNFLESAGTKKSPVQAELDKNDAYFCSHGISLNASVTLWVLTANAASKTRQKKDKTIVSNETHTNENSIVLMLECKGHKIFLMGDSTEYTEAKILAHYHANFLATDKKKDKWCFLKVGHHGSNTSSSQNWLDAIQPNMSIISSDTKSFNDNGLGLPDDVKVAQLSQGLNHLSSSFAHSIVYYDQKKLKFVKKDMGTLALCSTIFDFIELPKPKKPTETELHGRGCSWVIWIDDQTGAVYYGWTGNKTTDSHDPIDGMLEGRVVMLSPGERA